MNDDQELILASNLFQNAESYATMVCENEEDIEAATAAILMRALELATPNFTPEQRSRLFMEEE